jgi:GPH family glycoside/pentoside/hexuronide:cation symporter
MAPVSGETGITGQAQVAMDSVSHSPARYARYAALGLPLAFASLPLYVHVPKLYSTVTPLSLAAIGIILLAVRSMDMIVDPLIGSLSDRAQARRGTIMAAALPVLALGYAALFYPPAFASGLSAGLWLTASLIVTYAGFSILMINYYAMGVGLAHAPHEHTRVALWREAAMLIGVLTASVLPSALMGALGLKAAYGVLAVILAVLLVLAAFVTLAMKGLRPPPPPQSRFLPFAILKYRRIRWILFVVLVNALPLAITSTLFLFFVEDVIGTPDQSGVMLGFYFLSAVAGMPLWSRLSARIGKINTLLFSMFASICCFIWAALLGRGDANAFYAVCFLSGMTLGADTVLLPAIFSEELDVAKAELGAGFGWWNFLNKAALALAAGIALPSLALGGYHPGIANSHQALMILSAAYAVLPCGCKVAAAAALYFSPLARNSVSQPAAATAPGGGA